MDLADERVREALAFSGPIGEWRTMPGSHTLLFDESIRFDADGHGELRLHSALGGPRRLSFRWRGDGYGVVACQPCSDEPVLSDAGEPEPADWFRIAFRFERAAGDIGSYWVMRERDRAGFWELTTPVVPA